MNIRYRSDGHTRCSVPKNCMPRRMESRYTVFSNYKKIHSFSVQFTLISTILYTQTKSASVQTLKNHIEKLRKRGIEPDMILVDYADLLRPVRSSGEKRHELEETYEGLRGLAQTYEFPIWTASQTNRGGLNAEVITMEAISEAFNKCFVADFIFSLSRTVEDKQSNKGRLFVAKNRNGQTVSYLMHLSTGPLYLLRFLIETRQQRR